ncbi:MAG: Ku protein [Actinobacteria bacterium]|nr:Ku protein [Actinomycetota bacterium]
MPPRTMWKGAISFGLVSIPIRMYPATEEKTLRFNQLHEEDGGRIRYKRVCAVDGEEVPYEEIVKGYEIEKDRYVILTDEDFDAVPVESSRAIDIQQFVDLEEIDPIYFQKTYYLVPEETGVKAYRLLQEAMSENGKVGIAKVAFREKEHLAALRFKDGVMVLETMYWPDEIRATEFEELDKDVKVRPQEVQMAQTLIENLSEEWDPDQYRDEYREALMDIVQKKAAGEEITVVEEPEPARVVDLMEALKASVEAAKRGRPASAAAAEEQVGKAKSGRGKKAAPKKAAARRKAG